MEIVLIEYTNSTTNTYYSNWQILTLVCPPETSCDIAFIYILLTRKSSSFPVTLSLHSKNQLQIIISNSLGHKNNLKANWKSAKLMLCSNKYTSYLHVLVEYNCLSHATLRLVLLHMLFFFSLTSLPF